MALYAEVSEGYAYVVSVMGTTGERGALPVEVPDVLARARRVFRLPVALGFGLRSPEQLKGFSREEHPDAVVFGSSLLRHLAAGGRAAAFMDVWNRPE